MCLSLLSDLQLDCSLSRCDPRERFPWLANLSTASEYRVFMRHASIILVVTEQNLTEKYSTTEIGELLFLVFGPSSQNTIFFVMVWTLAMKHKLRDYSELKEVDVFDEKSLKAQLRFLTLVAKLSKAG